MASISATEARKRLFSLIDDVRESHQPIEIQGKRGSAVLLSKDDWRAIQETLYLTSIPGMCDAIVEGMTTPAEVMSEEPGWSVSCEGPTPGESTANINSSTALTRIKS